MSWGLELVARELGAEIRACGMDLNVSASVLIRADVALKMPRGKTTDYYRKIIGAEIKKYRDKQKAELEARQITLL
jgi:hypothetical protein